MEHEIEQSFNIGVICPAEVMVDSLVAGGELRVSRTGPTFMWKERAPAMAKNVNIQKILHTFSWNSSNQRI